MLVVSGVNGDAAAESCTSLRPSILFVSKRAGTKSALLWPLVSLALMLLLSNSFAIISLVFIVVDIGDVDDIDVVSAEDSVELSVELSEASVCSQHRFMHSL